MSSTKRSADVIKAVFFDLYQTLVRYEPPREELESKILKSYEIEVVPEALVHPIVIADEFIYNEIARQPLNARSDEEKLALYAKHQAIVLHEVGIEGNQKLIMSLLAAMQQAQTALALFSDVAPALAELKQKGLILGLISNVEQDIKGTLDKLGLTSWLTKIVISQDAGAAKPRPEIFRYALEKAEVLPTEAIYVGDQYQVDIAGARGVGMKGILIDRTDYYRNITDCPRIKDLGEVKEYL
jgi:putative hydrolase of the HAD superfamily